MIRIWKARRGQIRHYSLDFSCPVSSCKSGPVRDSSVLMGSLYHEYLPIVQSDQAVAGLCDCHPNWMLLFLTFCPCALWQVFRRFLASFFNFPPYPRQQKPLLRFFGCGAASDCFFTTSTCFLLLFWYAWLLLTFWPSSMQENLVPGHQGWWYRRFEQCYCSFYCPMYSISK